MGGENVLADVYRIKQNVPQYVGAVHWCTASMRGESSEVLRLLYEGKEVTKKQFADGYYRRTRAEELGFQIEEV
jgi:hypothetical protein